MADIVLKVNGRQYDGWETARVTRGIESIAGGFELSVSERWTNVGQPWPIAEEDECSLLVNGKTLITGYVDKRTLSIGPEEHSVSVSGRDRAGMLVDCSAVLDIWELANTALEDLVRKLCAPFGIGVSVSSGLRAAALHLAVGRKQGAVSGAGKGGQRSGMGVPKPPGKFSVDPGESAFEVIDRACRMAGVLPVSDGRGNVVLTRAGSGRASTALVQGGNVLSASASFDASGRYRKYVVVAMRQGTDEDYGAGVAGVSGTALDLNVRRSERTLVIRPEASATPGSAQARASWEGQVRAARGDSVNVTVHGWTQKDGSLWPINALVLAELPALGIRGRMLITQVVFSVDESSGLTSQMVLRRPDAFIPEPTIPATDGLWKELNHGV